MSILSWNCWSLGNLSEIPSLKDLIHAYHSDVIFLCETLVLYQRTIRMKFGFDSCFSVNVNGISNGLTLFWKHTFTYSLLNFSINFINVEVQVPRKPCWQITSFYGFSKSDRRRDSWNLIHSISSFSLLHWCIIGDFNDLLSNDETIGNSEHANRLIEEFHDSIFHSNLHDLPMKGYKYTWARRKGKPNDIEEKLDRALALDWHFPSIQTHKWYCI